MPSILWLDPSPRCLLVTLAAALGHAVCAARACHSQRSLPAPRPPGPRGLRLACPPPVTVCRPIVLGPACWHQRRRCGQMRVRTAGSTRPGLDTCTQATPATLLLSPLTCHCSSGWRAVERRCWSLPALSMQCWLAAAGRPAWPSSTTCPSHPSPVRCHGNRLHFKPLMQHAEMQLALKFRTYAYVHDVAPESAECTLVVSLLATGPRHYLNLAADGCV